MKKILFLTIFLTGCSTYGKCPTPPAQKPIHYAINDIPDNASNSQKGKAIAASFLQCTTALKECHNDLDPYREQA